MKMILPRIVCTTVNKLCDVQYYVLAEPCTDPHYAPEPSFVVDDRYFDTEEEAEAFMQECRRERRYIWCLMSVCKRVTELE